MYTKLQIERIAAGMMDSLGNHKVATSSCVDCQHFREREGEICTLVGRRPPARVIVNGCEAYKDEDDIPF